MPACLQLFSAYDTSRQGSLRPKELARLIRDIMPDVTRAELHYFLVRAHTDSAKTPTRSLAEPAWTKGYRCAPTQHFTQVQGHRLMKLLPPCLAWQIFPFPRRP